LQILFYDRCSELPISEISELFCQHSTVSLLQPPVSCYRLASLPRCCICVWRSLPQHVKWTPALHTRDWIWSSKR